MGDEIDELRPNPIHPRVLEVMEKIRAQIERRPRIFYMKRGEGWVVDEKATKRYRDGELDHLDEHLVLGVPLNHLEPRPLHPPES